MEKQDFPLLRTPPLPHRKIPAPVSGTKRVVFQKKNIYISHPPWQMGKDLANYDLTFMSTYSCDLKHPYTVYVKKQALHRVSRNKKIILMFLTPSGGRAWPTP